MTTETIKNQKPKTSPYPITLKTIYNALYKAFSPELAYIVYSNIRSISVHSSSPGFQTLGIDKEGNLFICEEFWHENILTETDICAFLSHELFHQILADTRLDHLDTKDPEFQLKQYAKNIAYDARINAYISRFLLKEEFDKLDHDPFSKFYTKKDEEENTLVSKEALLNLLFTEGYFNYDFYEYNVYSPIHDYLYYSNAIKDFIDVKDLYDLILSTLRKRPKPPEDDGEGMFIGSHGVSDGDSDLGDPISKEENEDYEKKDLQQISAQISAEIQDKNVGHNDEVHQVVISELQNTDRVIDVNTFKRLAFNNTFKNIRSEIHKTKRVPYTTPVIPSTISRTDYVKMLAGIPMLIWNSHKEEKDKKDLLCPIYLDVSGSMWSHLPEIIRLITNIEDDLDYVWGFSDYVHKHTLKELEDRQITSSGGTCFNCVLNHAMENNFKHIVVITDGCAYAHDKTINKAKQHFSTVSVILTDGYYWADNILSTTFNDTKFLREVTI